MANFSYWNSTIIETVFAVGFIIEHCVAWGIVTVNAIILLFIILKKPLRTPFNTVIGSMAVCCLLFAFFNLFPSIVIKHGPSTRYLYSIIFIPFGNSTASILNLHVALLCILRYFFVASPFAYLQHVTKKTISIILAIIWVGMFGFTYGMQAANGYLAHSNTNARPAYRNHSLAIKIIYYTTCVGIVAIFPIFVIIITYLQIHYIIIRHIHNIDKQRKSRRNTLTSCPCHQHTYNKDKAVKQMIYLLLMFFLSWIPFFTFGFFINKTDFTLWKYILNYIFGLSVYVYIFFCPLFHIYYAPDIRNELKLFYTSLMGVFVKAIKRLLCFRN